jgi:hypothetical protein
MRPSRVIVPPLSRYSFQFPHVGDCTHDGHPLSHAHAATTKAQVTAGVGGTTRANRLTRKPGHSRLRYLDEETEQNGSISKSSHARKGGRDD